MTAEDGFLIFEQFGRRRISYAALTSFIVV